MEKWNKNERLHHNKKNERKANVIIRTPNVIIRTPVGETKPLKLENVVRQGTIYGPEICGASMDKVNGIGKEVVTPDGPNLPVKILAYGDDLTKAGDVNTANNTIETCNIMEKRKKITFITSKVKNGRFGQVIKYKLVGTWMDESGKYNINIEKNRHMENLVKKIGNEIKWER